MEKRVKISLGVTVGGVVVLILAIILGWVVMPLVIDAMIKKESQLKNGTLIYEKWLEFPLPMYLNGYFFNVTNPEDFEGDNWGAKPILQEVGPYVYKEKRVKYDVQSHPDRDTVSYRQNITYTFVPEMSVGPETDTLTLVNGPLIAVATVLYPIPETDMPTYIKRAIMDLLSGPLSRDTYLKKGIPIRDALFQLRLNFVYDILLGLLENVFNIKLPPEIQFVEGTGYAYAPFLKKNGTNADGLWEIYSGIKDNSKINRLRTVNGEETIERRPWDGEECNKVKGGDGFFHPYNMDKNMKLEVFAPEICRTAWVAFEKELEFRGISVHRYKATKELFENPKVYPENQCYCVTPREPLNATCAPSGVARLRSCKTGIPVIISKPHFLDADQSVLDMVEGMNPDPEKHDIFLDVVPTLGIPVRGVRRLQISFETQPFEGMGPIWTTVSRIFFPYLWIDEGAELDDALLSELNSFYFTPLKIATIGKWVAVGVGSALTIGGGFCLGYFAWWRR